MSLPTDPVAHIRENLTSWIHHAPEDVIRQLLKVRRNLDANIKKPSPPAGWTSLAAVAKARGLCSGHIARICRDVYCAQELARKCIHSGRETWYLSPAAIAQLRASDAPTAAPAAVGSDEIEGGSK